MQLLFLLALSCVEFSFPKLPLDDNCLSSLSALNASFSKPASWCISISASVADCGL